MSALRVFAAQSQHATVVCPSCGERREIEIPADNDNTHEVTSECSCGRRDEVIIDKRRAPRMTVSISGELVHGNSQPKPITIRVLSRLGLGFESLERPSFSIGDAVSVELFLEDLNAAVIRKKAHVRNLNGRFVGAEFDALDKPSAYDAMCDQALDAYTRFADDP